MKTQKPFYVKIFLLLCRKFSQLISWVHSLATDLKLLEIPAYIGEAPGGVHKNLQKIWYARLLKKLVSAWVRSPLRRHALQLVKLDFQVPANTGLVFVTCHTPWKRLLVQWSYENHFILVIDTGKSIQRRTRLKNQRKGYNELLHIIRHLQYGGHIIIAADVFDKSNNHKSEILGKPGNLSLLPARLARIAGVPMMAAVPRVRNGMIQIHAGPRYDHQIQEAEMGPLMQNLLGYFENEIKMDPSIWSYFVNDPLSKFRKKRIV